MAAYQNWGFQTTGEEVVDQFAPQIQGRTFLITGTSAHGLGALTAIKLARHSPKNLILVARSKAKVDSVIDEIHRLNSSIVVTFVACELSDLDSVRRAAKEIIDNPHIPTIDVVINNAGVMAILEYTVDKNGNEMSLVVNHLSHFLLTNLLMPKIKAAGPQARIVNLTSSGHKGGPFRFDDYNFSGGKEYDPWSAYSQSKTANILFTIGLAQRGVQSFAVHPGSIYGTGLATHLSAEDYSTIDAIARKNTGHGFTIDPPKTHDQGVSTTLVAALRPDLDKQSGAYLADCQVDTPSAYASDSENASRLWKLSKQLVGQAFDV